MKRTRRSRGVFTVDEDAPENDQDLEELLMRGESSEVAVSEFLNAVDALCVSWLPNEGKPGSVEMVDEIKRRSRLLRDELEPRRRDPWRVAHFAMALAEICRDLQTNETHFRPLQKYRETQTQRASARAGANQRRKAEADELALQKFAAWQQRTQLVLRDRHRQPLPPEERVRKYKTTAKLKKPEKERITGLLAEGRIPSLE